MSQFCSFLLTAGEKYSVNLILSPSYEKIGFRNRLIDNPFDAKLSYNFGVDYRYYIEPEISFSAGLQFNKRGFRTHPTYKTSDGQVQDFDDAVVVISANYLSLPFEIQYNFQPFFRTEISLHTGLCYGYLVNQTFKGKRISNEIQPSEEFLKGLEEKSKAINWFDKSYIGWIAGFSVSRAIKSRLVITVNPTYYRQLDRALNPYGPVKEDSRDRNGNPVLINPKFDSFSLNLKLGYYFSDQIENTKKTL